MTEAGWLTVAGYVVAIAVAISTAVFGFVGWLVSKGVEQNDRDKRNLSDSLKELRESCDDLEDELNVLRLDNKLIREALRSKGILVQSVREHRSPPPHIAEGSA